MNRATLKPKLKFDFKISDILNIDVLKFHILKMFSYNIKYRIFMFIFI